MKPFSMLIGVCVAGGLGYFFEPTLRPHLCKIAADANAPQNPYGIVPSEVPYGMLPKTVTLKKAVNFIEPSSGIKATIQKGATAKLICVEGEDVAISPGEMSISLKIPYKNTNLIEQLSVNSELIAELKRVKSLTLKPGSSLSLETPPTAEPAPVSTPRTPDPAPPASQEITKTTPPAVAQNTEPAAQKPKAAAEVPDPFKSNTSSSPAKPDPFAPAASTSSANLPDSQIVETMKSSLTSSPLKDFTASDIVEWKALAPENIDGVNYQIGTVSYKKETPFGVKLIPAKALIQNGKVVKWVWAKSGTPIN